jgi:hypothetical protein
MRDFRTAHQHELIVAAQLRLILLRHRLNGESPLKFQYVICSKLRLCSSKDGNQTANNTESGLMVACVLNCVAAQLSISTYLRGVCETLNKHSFNILLLATRALGEEAWVSVV